MLEHLLLAVQGLLRSCQIDTSHVAFRKPFGEWPEANWMRDALVAEVTSSGPSRHAGRSNSKKHSWTISAASATDPVRR